MYRVLVHTCLAIFLLACTATAWARKPVPLIPPTYTGTTNVRTQLTAAVTLTPAVADARTNSVLVSSGGIFIPVSTTPKMRQRFNEEDQKIFVDALRKEIVRLGLVRGASGTGSPDLVIEIIFDKTLYINSVNRYSLDVTLRITGPAGPLEKHYHVQSDEGESFWEMAGNNVSEGKAKAGQRLITALISDIEVYLQPR